MRRMYNWVWGNGLDLSHPCAGLPVTFVGPGTKVQMKIHLLYCQCLCSSEPWIAWGSQLGPLYSDPKAALCLCDRQILGGSKEARVHSQRVASLIPYMLVWVLQETEMSRQDLRCKKVSSGNSLEKKWGEIRRGQKNFWTAVHVWLQARSKGRKEGWTEVSYTTGQF